MMTTFLPRRFLRERFLESTPIHSLSFQPFYDTLSLSRHIKQRPHGVYMGHPVFTALSLIGDPMYKSSLGRYVPGTGPFKVAEITVFVQHFCSPAGFTQILGAMAS
jgi:hypothetical protein